MKFSIIIPVYNVEKYLGECIESVLAQSYKDYEILLVDDGSPDSCPDICDNYALKDSRIKVIHKTNGGLSDARNAGLDMANGDYVMFLDSDDWWDSSELLSKISYSIQSSSPDIIIFGMKKYYQIDDRIASARIPKKCDRAEALSHAQALQSYMQSNSFVACACDKAVRRTFIEQNRQRFVKGQLSEDIEWCCKLLLKQPYIEVIEEDFYIYRQQVPTSITSNVGSKNIIDISNIIKNYCHYENSLPLRHFLANQYVLLLTNFMRLPKCDRKTLSAEIKKHWWLLDYNWYPYVNKVSIVKPFGFNITKNLLRLYYLIHR